MWKTLWHRIQGYAVSIRLLSVAPETKRYVANPIVYWKETVL